MAFDPVSYAMGKKAGGGGGGDITVEPLSVTSNGSYSASGKAYSPVNVSVPNSYTASDEGKVVDNGALVAQTAHAEVTSNGTIDTTLNNSVTVNVQPTGTILHSGSITPAERVTSISFDCGVSDPQMFLIVPHSESPMKSGGLTAVGGWYSKNTYYHAAMLKTGASGASLNGASLATSGEAFDMNGTVATLYATKETPTISAGKFETITYDWFAW